MAQIDKGKISDVLRVGISETWKAWDSRNRYEENDIPYYGMLLARRFNNHETGDLETVEFWESIDQVMSILEWKIEIAKSLNGYKD